MQSSKSPYRLTLFVTGATVRSARAVANVRHFCDDELTDEYDLDVVDLYDSPQRARTEQVVAAPTLVRYWPEPARRLIGDMSDGHRLREVIKL